MIVNVWMSIPAKKRKYPEKRKKKQPKEYYISKCQQNGAQFLHLASQGWGLCPLLPVSCATAL